jgi:glycosyltransferase involved in cell wall biosynthesis
MKTITEPDSAPLVSVIIPSFNSGKFIAETLKSVINQTYQYLEVIVVDDGSTDDTIIQIDPYHDRILYIYQGNRGLGGARNTGIKAASGELIAFLDADDLWFPNYIETMVEGLINRPETAVLYCWWSFIDEQGETLPEKGLCTEKGNIYLSLVTSNRFPPMAALTRKYCVDEVGGFDENRLISEDWDFWLRIAQKGYIFDYLPNVLVKYRFHGSNMTLNVANSHKRYLNVLDKLFQQADLPAEVLKLKGCAYGQVYLTSALYSWARCDFTMASKYLSEGIEKWPDLLCEEQTYYRLVCANQPPGYRDTEFFKDIPEMEKRIDEWVCDLFHDPSISTKVRGLERKAQTAKTVALARQYYHAGDDLQVRRLLNTLITQTPYLFLKPQISSLWMRSFVGRRRIQKIKQNLHLHWKQAS